MTWPSEIWTSSIQYRMAEIFQKEAQKFVQNSLLLKPGKLFVFLKIADSAHCRLFRP